jgi:hypothetical protein
VGGTKKDTRAVYIASIMRALRAVCLIARAIARILHILNGVRRLARGERLRKGYAKGGGDS